MEKQKMGITLTQEKIDTYQVDFPDTGMKAHDGMCIPD
jgi:hypothetical protein